MDFARSARNHYSAFHSETSENYSGGLMSFETDNSSVYQRTETKLSYQFHPIEGTRGRERAEAIKSYWQSNIKNESDSLSCGFTFMFRYTVHLELNLMHSLR